jgi:6-phosphofructokinase 1
MESNDHRGKTLAVLVGGGPAPGINGVIRSVTIQARNSGLRVLGLYDGFQWLAQGDATRHTELLIEDVSRIHYRGGSILRTSRSNPQKDPKQLAAVLRSLSELGVDFLVTIGGDDTATSAMKLQELAGDQISIAHVPKTIDNDLPLPGDMPTFGYQTARHVGVGIVESLLEDAQTTGRWYFVVSMGRKAGHLALGVGKAAGATLTVIAEEFRKRSITLDTLCDLLEAAIIKRMAMGRPYGVAILAEGLSELIDPEELKRFSNLERDAHGNIRYSEIELGRTLKREVRRRFEEREIPVTIVAKRIGYELRCADPIPYDLEYSQELGFAAVQYLLADGSGAIVALERGSVNPLPFDSLMDPGTKRARVREVDIDSDAYRQARHYMIRLAPSDFAGPKSVARLATIGKMTPEAFVSRFRYLTGDPPVRDAGEGGK